MSEKTCGCYYGNRDGVLGECDFPPHHQGPHSWETPVPVRSAERRPCACQVYETCAICRPDAALSS